MDKQNTEHTVQQINAKEILDARSPGLSKKMPRFVVRWIERIIHQDDFNDILNRFGHLSDVEFIEASQSYLDIKVDIEGLENIPKNQRYMFVSNHPLGGVDGTLLLATLNRQFGLTKCLVNNFLMDVEPLRHLFVPINKMGTQERSSIQAVDDLYESDSNIFIFPAGLCSRKVNGKITDLEWHKHFVQKARKYDLPIVPIYFDGKNSNTFYNVALIRKILRIKLNIEMFLLPKEMFKQKGKHITIKFAKPIQPSTLDKSKRPNKWAEEIKQKVYAMSESK